MWFVRVSPSFVQSDDPTKEVITFPLVPVQQVLRSCIPLPLFREGRDSIQDSHRSGRPHVDNHTTELLVSLLDVERRWTARELQ